MTEQEKAISDVVEEFKTQLEFVYQRVNELRHFLLSKERLFITDYSKIMFDIDSFEKWVFKGKIFKYVHAIESFYSVNAVGATVCSYHFKEVHSFEFVDDEFKVRHVYSEDEKLRYIDLTAFIKSKDGNEDFRYQF